MTALKKEKQWRLIISWEWRKIIRIYTLSKVKSKGKEIDYGKELKCQNYLLPNRIFTWDDQVDIFAYKSRMNELKYNFRGKDLCICGMFLDNENLFNCEALNRGKQKAQIIRIYLMET